MKPPLTGRFARDGLRALKIRHEDRRMIVNMTLIVDAARVDNDAVERLVDEEIRRSVGRDFAHGMFFTDYDLDPGVVAELRSLTPALGSSR